MPGAPCDARASLAVDEHALEHSRKSRCCISPVAATNDYTAVKAERLVVAVSRTPLCKSGSNISRQLGSETRDVVVGARRGGLHKSHSWVSRTRLVPMRWNIRRDRGYRGRELSCGDIAAGRARSHPRVGGTLHDRASDISAQRFTPHLLFVAGPISDIAIASIDEPPPNLRPELLCSNESGFCETRRTERGRGIEGAQGTDRLSEALHVRLSFRS